MSDPLLWTVPGAPAAHIASLIALAALASWGWHRYRWRGLLVPALVLCYSELQFNAIVVGYYHAQILVDAPLLAATPAVILLYASVFKRIPVFMLSAGYGVLLLDVLDGFQVSFGFGTPTEPYAALKEIVSWCVVCLAAWWDNRN